MDLDALETRIRNKLEYYDSSKNTNVAKWTLNDFEVYLDCLLDDSYVSKGFCIYLGIVHGIKVIKE